MTCNNPKCICTNCSNDDCACEVSRECLCKPDDLLTFKGDKCDNEEYVYEISVNIAPVSRGKGYGKKLIINGINRFLTEVDNCKFIRAEVKKLNEPSNKLFRNCGFNVIKDQSAMNIFQLSLSM